MQPQYLSLFWGQRVVSQSGWSATLRGAYLAPRAGRITHLLLRRGIWGSSQVLNLDSAREGPDGRLVVPVRPERRSVAPGRGAVPFSPRTVVHCAGGTTMPLQGLILDSRSYGIEFLLVGKRGNGVAVARRDVQNLTSGSPSVTLGPAQVGALPVFRPDEETQKNALAALASADSAGDIFGEVTVEVREGTVYLEGHVHLPVQKLEAEEAVRRAKGVLGVHNAIVTDWELSIAIAEALARDGVTRRGLVTVQSSLGRVTLRGYLDSQETISRAVAAAGAVPGVRSIERQIQVRPSAVPEPVTEGNSATQSNEPQKPDAGA